MFKSLRDRLKGVSKQLEDELESQMGDELERQLQEELARETAPVAQEPPSEEARGVDEAPGPESGPGAAPGSGSIPARPQEAAEAKPAPEHGTPEPSEFTAPPAPGSDPQPERADDPASRREGDQPGGPATEAAHTHADVPVPSAPASVPAAKAPKVTQPVTGRKMFTEEEIEARLKRELEAAVETQKAVEEVAVPGQSKFTINEDVLDEILWELELALLESDVAVPVIEAIKESVKEQLLSLSVGKGRPEDIVAKVLRTAIKRVLSVNPIDFDSWLKQKLTEKKPVVIMFVGVNGTGKTTSIGRLAYRLQQQGVSSVMAAGDTFRAGAIEQLALHGERLGVKVVKHSAGADPAAVAYDAIEHAKARHKDVVLLDTAGRMQNNVSLMDEMDKIRRVANPDMVVFVGDSLAGNDAVEQARKFDEVVDIDGAILTKTDVDAKGGAALSVAYTINKPLLFVGVGQGYPDLKPFDAGWMVDRLFGDEEAAVAAT